MKFQLVNNHIILSLQTDAGTKNCVFDTGSPLTIFFEPVKEFYFDGDAHVFSPNPLAMMMSLYRPSIEELIGMQIDGIIGTECFNDSNVLIDFKNLELSISSNPLDADFDVAMQSILGLPTFKIGINDQEVVAAYDSGAMYSFVSSDLVQTLNLTAHNKSFEDFNPMLGHFTADLYSGNIRIGSSDLGAKNIASSHPYDTAIQMVGVEAFVGTDALRETIVGFSYIENRMGVRK